MSEQKVITLIPYAIYSRYPDDYFEVCRLDVELAIAIAQKVYKEVGVRININPDSNLTIF
jgi:hypothetical protein